MSDLEWMRELQRTGRDPEVAALGRCSLLLKNGVQAWQIIPKNVGDCDALRNVRSSQTEIADQARSCWEIAGQIATDLTHAHDNFLEMDRLRNRPESNQYRIRGEALARRAAAQLPALERCIDAVTAVQRKVQQRIAAGVKQQSGSGSAARGDGSDPRRRKPAGVWPGSGGGPVSRPVDRPEAAAGCRPPMLGYPVPANWRPIGPLADEFASGRCNRVQCPGETDSRVLCPGWPRPVRGADLFTPSDRACRNAVPPPYCSKSVAGPSTQPVPFGTCVNMRASPDAVDRTLAGYDVRSYNCHFYTFTFANGDPPTVGALGWGSTFDLSGTHLARHGYRQLGVKEPARVGDIVLVPGVMRVGNTTTKAYLHSARVTAVSARGMISRLRQKPNPDDCVVDTTLEEFKRIYPSSTGLYELWRSTAPGNSGAPGE